MSLDHCADLVRAGDPDRYLATMTAPPEGRARLFPLYAFNLEVARAPWVSAEPMIGAMRLKFWADAVATLAQGGRVTGHPVIEALAGAGQGAAPVWPLLEALVAARWADLSHDPPQDMAALVAYLDATAAGVMQAAARWLTGGDGADAAAAGIGRAAGAAALLRALPELCCRGHLPLPGPKPADRSALAGGHTTPDLAAAVAGLGLIGRKALVTGREAARQAPRAARPALIAGWRAGLVLRAAGPGVDVVADFRPESEARRRATLLWSSLTGRV